MALGASLCIHDDGEDGIFVFCCAQVFGMNVIKLIIFLPLPVPTSYWVSTTSYVLQNCFRYRINHSKSSPSSAPPLPPAISSP